ncbi:MAG TPA: hypothetical protein VEF04_09240, partial [Blastocatellia bacterium]|nr:hypothetical protein [Blastocatellia bacterium]
MPRDRKFDTWKFKLDGEEIAIEVRYSGKLFSVEYEPFGINESSSDIAALKERVEKAVREKRVKNFKPYLRVGVRGNFSPRFGGEITTSSLHLYTQVVEIGSRSAGAAVWRCKDRDRVEDGKPHVGATCGDWLRAPASYQKPDGQVALIPDTPENRAAIKTIFESFEKLRLRLLDLLNQGKIEETLALINNGGMRLLASSNDEERGE